MKFGVFYDARKSILWCTKVFDGFVGWHESWSDQMERREIETKMLKFWLHLKITSHTHTSQYINVKSSSKPVMATVQMTLFISNHPKYTL